MVQNVQEAQLVGADDFEAIRELGQQLRVDSIRSSTAAGSGHPTSSMSAADLMAVLLTRHLRYDWENPRMAANDHLIFSKGHASPLIYSMFKAAGVVTDEELLTFRKMGSRLQGHPTPLLPWVDVATGSLGQGLPIAVGVAIAGKFLDKLDYRVWTVCGDSELAEGSIWEGLDKAAHYQLGNFIAIFDVNRLGQRGETEFGWDLEVYRKRVEAFGCRALVIDGHDVREIDRAMAEAREGAGRPTVIIARTVKGKGVVEVENKVDWHGKPLPEDLAEKAIKELGGIRDLRISSTRPEPGEPAPFDGIGEVKLPTYEKGEKVATRKAYGDALLALGALPLVVAMDGEVSNSTMTIEFAKQYPDRFFEMFIAEQQLVATAVGMSVRGYKPFASTFAAFFSRAYDFVRMAAVSEANIRLSGSHAGVEIGQDGPSQMALEDLASIRAVQGSTVLYPSDGVSTARLVELMAETDGIVYMRTTRGAYPVIHDAAAGFSIGGSATVRSSAEDKVTLIGAGVTLHNCLAAAEQLAVEGINARVIDLYSIKPVDVAALRLAVKETGRIVVAEDHYPEGGMGAAVLEALAPDGVPFKFAHCAVQGLPGSGKPEELMDQAGISARHIVEAATTLVSQG